MNIVRGYKLAKKASGFSKFDKARSRHLGCVICYRNQIISVGWNCEKEHPAQKKYNKERGFDTSGCKNSLHAEMHALILCKDYDVDWSKFSNFFFRSIFCVQFVKFNATNFTKSFFYVFGFCEQFGSFYFFSVLCFRKYYSIKIQKKIERSSNCFL